MFYYYYYTLYAGIYDRSDCPSTAALYTTENYASHRVDRAARSRSSFEHTGVG